MLQGFRDFVMRGNVVDLAIAVVVGGAFGKVIDALVSGIITPLIGAIFGQPKVDFTVGPFNIGLVVTGIINFLTVAAAIYFLVVVPKQQLESRMKKPEAPAAPETPADVKLLAEIRDLLAKR